MKKVTAYNRIRKAMRDNERSLLADIRLANKSGRGWHSDIYGLSMGQNVHFGVFPTNQFSIQPNLFSF